MGKLISKREEINIMKGKYHIVSKDTKRKTLDYQMIIIYKFNVFIEFCERLKEYFTKYIRTLRLVESTKTQRFIYKKNRARIINHANIKKELKKLKEQVYSLVLVEKIISEILLKIFLINFLNKFNLLKTK
jgi:hypothetical protein